MIDNLTEAISHAREKTEELRERAGFDTDNERYRMSESEKQECLECATEHEQLASWLEELKGLRLFVEWAIDAGFGYDNISDELFAKYKDDIKDMRYTDGFIYIATREANKESEGE